MKNLLFATLVTAVTIAVAQAQITGTFVPSQDGVNSFQSVDGTSAFSSSERTLDLWHDRAVTFEIGSLPSPLSGGYQGQNKAGASPNPTATEVVTTITGLTPGVSYDIYMIMGITTNANGGNQHIDAGFVSGSLTTLLEGNSTSTGLPLGAGLPWVAAEQLIGSIIAEASGEAKVYVNATLNAERSIYNGLSYIETPPPVAVGHYWDFTVEEDAVPYVVDDLAGNLNLIEFGIADVQIDLDYGEAFDGSGVSLNTARSGGDYFTADTYGGGRASALEFGKDDFAISYWVYDDGTDNDLGGLDEDLRGARVLDCADGVSGGLEISVTSEGFFSLQVSDLLGNESLSVLQTGTPFETLAFPTDKWVHVAINVDRGSDLIEVYFDGVSQGSYDISELTGDIACTQDLEVGVINGGGDEDSAQKSGLDELAIYPGLLSSDDVAGLVAAITTPGDIIAGFAPADAPTIRSISYNEESGVAQIIFPTLSGSTYTVQGSTDLASWLPLNETDTIPVDGTGEDVSFDHNSGEAAFFYRVIGN